ncbi:MAG: ATP-dependent sacrificial sulfur transferase LarE [Actinomycetota bacterium]
MAEKSPEEKLCLLREKIRSMGRVAVAFSGGVDSSFLLKVSSDTLGKNAMAITIDSPSFPRKELDRAAGFARKYGISHVVIKAGLGGNKFVKNDRLRCYYCKSEEFRNIIETAKEYGIGAVLDGQNEDDADDYRPGSRAASELGVISPLKDCRLKKHQIRDLSRKMGLSGWDRPSLACLASRVPYGTEITESLLKIIDHLESYLLEKGFSQVRVRHHGHLARIEVDRDEFKKFLDKNLAADIAEEFKGQGYVYITLDIEGYRTGSMNKLINRPE